MLSVLAFSFNAIMPILLLVLLGYILKRRGLFTQEWLRIANRFNFHYCLCALMFCNVYTLEDLSGIDWSLALFIIVGLLTLTGIGFLLSRLTNCRREQKGVMIQVAFRSNFAIIGLPLAESLGVPGGMALLTAMQAPAVIYFNLMAVLVLSLYSDKKADFRRTLSGIAHNPLIRGLVLGLAALWLRSVLPRNGEGELVFSLSGSLPFLYSALTSLSKIATPLALVVLGGQFEFSAVHSLGKKLVVGVLARLVLAPAVGFGLAWGASRLGLISLSPAVIAVLIPLFCTPVAVSSSVMATEMEADDVLAGQLVIWTTLFSLISLFCLIAFFRYNGLL